MTSSYHVASQLIQGAFFKHENAVFNGEQERESISRVRVGKKNPLLGTSICHRSASLLMPNVDPGDEFLYPTIALMIMDSYILLL